MNKSKLTQVFDQKPKFKDQLGSWRKEEIEKDDLLKVFVELDTDSTTDLAGGI